LYYLLMNMVQKDPSAITGTIAKGLGWIINLAFNAVYAFTQKNSLGISIIVLTIVVYTLLLPLSAKSQKSMMAMQRLNPEIEKIKKKYGQTKDPELTRKMNAEIQALYSKHKVNPLGGCLPLIIQMPIFFALIYLMNQSYLYITHLGNIYYDLANKIMNDVPHYKNLFLYVFAPHIPKGLNINMDSAHDMVKALSKLTSADWAMIFDPNSGLASFDPGGGYAKLATDSNTIEAIHQIFTQKQNIEMFFGLNLLDRSGWAFPGVIIPILTAGTTFLTSWLSTKLTQNSAAPGSGMQQKIMLFAMPLIMGFFTVNYAAGVGVYWITSSAYRTVQQFFLNKKYRVDSPADSPIETKEAKRK